MVSNMRNLHCDSLKLDDQTPTPKKYKKEYQVLIFHLFLR